MYWSQAIIPIGKEKVTLLPKTKSKYTVFPSNDPQSQILYQEIDFANYLILSKSEKIGEQSESTDSLWTLEFDGSCCSSGSRASIVLISPTSQNFPSSYKLSFENTNNTAEYEALLLGIEEAKKRNIKLLKARGDVELLVKQVKNVFLVKNERLKHYRN